MENLNFETKLSKIVHDMRQASDEVVGASMSAYMKNHFSFLGVKSPERKQIQNAWFQLIKKEPQQIWDLAYGLWNLPEREYQYIAMDLLKKQKLSFYQLDDALKLEELVTTKSWWDSVDGIASNNVGAFFKAFPEQRDKIIGKWRESDNLWLNRTCLIFQLKYKEQLDFELLQSLIVQFQPNKDFFIQKAIGWALRQHSKTFPLDVEDFVKNIELEGLAKREALKYV